MRILGRLNVGGPARQACLLHERLAETFATILVVGRLAGGEDDMSYLLPSERDVRRIPEMSREVSPLADLVALWKIFRLLRQQRPAIVHTHAAKAGALGRIAAALAGVPIIVHTYHGHVFHSYFGALRSRIFLNLERLLGRLSTCIVTISPGQREEITAAYRVVPREKAAVIRNGFPLDAFLDADRDTARRALGIEKEEFVVVWAARMVPVKDVTLLGQTIALAAARRSAIRFLVIGDGDERQTLERHIEGHENVRLIGWERDMAKVWAAADAALLTSRNEGTPTALIEAMAAGKPFVAVAVGGVPDLAMPPCRALPGGFGQEATNGFLTERSPEALLHCLLALEADRAGARRMGEAGRAFALAEFSSARLVREMTELYCRLISEHEKRVSRTSQL